MTKVIADITMSLDGFVTGPDPDLEHGLGHGGEALHEWAFSDDPVDAEQLRAGTEHSGAVVMGRRLFDIIDGPGGWNDEVGFGAREAGSPPFFVVTHIAPESRRLTDLDFTFVTDGIASAIQQARRGGGRQGRRHHGWWRRHPAAPGPWATPRRRALRERRTERHAAGAAVGLHREHLVDLVAAVLERDRARGHVEAPHPGPALAATRRPRASQSASRLRTQARSVSA